MEETADLAQPPGPAAPALVRLDEQLDWHNRKAKMNKDWYRGLKVGQITTAASIPVVAAAGAPGWVAGALGALVVVMEGVNQVYRWHDTWINYRTTCELLSRERALYLSSAGPYATHPDRPALLAMSVEDVLSRQHTEWTSAHQATEGEAEGRARGG